MKKAHQIRKTMTKQAGVLAAVVLAAGLSSIPAYAANRWKMENGNRYYMQDDQVVVNQWFSTSQEITYQQKLPSDPVRENETRITWYYAGPDGAVYKDGWHEIDGQLYYFNASGANTRKGWITDGDKRYYADENGIRNPIGWFSITNVNSKGQEYTNWYYAGPDGSIYRDGWHDIDGKTYYFYSAGNSPRKTWVTVGDYRYYVDEQGAKQTGWFAITGENSQGVKYENWYYGVEDGAVVRNGWQQKDGIWYFFDANGLSYRKRWYVDPTSQKRYYLNQDGILENKGWFSITGTNSQGVEYVNWYYATEDGSVYTDGYYEIDGSLYGFDKSGLMYKSRWLKKNDKSYYYAGESGVIARNGWFSIPGQDDNGETVDNWYFADENGLVKRTSESKWRNIDGQRYFLSSSGKLQTGWVDDKRSFCNEDGVALTGWQYLEIPEDWIEDSEYLYDYVRDNGEMAYFYFYPSTGKKKYSTSGRYSVMTVDGKEYCFDNYGIMQTGWVELSSKTPEITGYRYFEKPDTKGRTEGEAVKGQWRYLECPEGLEDSEDAGWYCFNASGVPYAASRNKEYEMRRIGDGNYLFNQSGMACKGLIQVDDDFYYFGNGTNGVEGAKGRVTITDGEADDQVYYFDHNSKGITGIRNGYFYYKGKLQRAESDAKYQVFEVPGVGKRLINTAGKVMKGTRVKDGMDQNWTVASNGEITVFGDKTVAALNVPEEMLEQ
ncbi:MAG: hypothetical protein Q4E86_10465 [Lachnospiraceae bacterium]|nr:hypothetical protein [Lachnospiraceae bacterium]